jgi:Tfp pilus assembly protein PilO
MRISLIHKSTHLIALISALFSIAGIGAYIFFFQQVEQHKSTLEEVRTTYASIEQNRDTLNTLVSTLRDTKDARESLRSRILTNENVINFLSLIETIAREQQVTLKTETLTVTPLDSVFETLDVRVSVEGEYTSLLKTLTLFEQLPYQVVVSDVQFTSTEMANVWRSTYDIRVTKFK